MPDENSFSGEHGGQCIPSELKAIMDEFAAAYLEIRDSQAYRDELHNLQSN